MPDVGNPPHEEVPRFPPRRGFYDAAVRLKAERVDKFPNLIKHYCLIAAPYRSQGAEIKKLPTVFAPGESGGCTAHCIARFSVSYVGIDRFAVGRYGSRLDRR